VVSQWLEEYNTIRPHGSLKGLTPIAFTEQWTNNQIIQLETLTL
jgi:transposase InsO family protein